MTPKTSTGIKWNEVTWYSRLVAVVLFIGIIPTLAFYIGTQYESAISVQYAPASIDISTQRQNPLNVGTSTSGTDTGIVNGYNPLFQLNDGPEASDCYYSKDGNVYVSNHNQMFTLVPEADVASFKDESMDASCFGVDKNNVYQDSTILAGYIPSLFKLLWSVKTPGGSIVFIERNTTSIGAFVYTINSSYKPVYQSTYLVQNGDPDTFSYFIGAYDKAPWAKDKNNVYCAGQIIPGAVPSSLHYTTDFRNITVQINGVQKTIGPDCNISS